MEIIKSSYERFCRARFALPTREAVAAIEEDIGIALPDDYREFLLDFNGGYFTEPDIIPQVDGCPLDCLTFMHGIGATHRSAEFGNSRAIALFKDDIEAPPDVVPIGYTLMGHFILLVTQPDGWNTVLLRTFDQSFFLANGIGGFFELLRDPL